jgi:hypothetical protein
MGDLRLGTGGDRASLARAAAFSYLRPQVSMALAGYAAWRCRKPSTFGVMNLPWKKQVAFPVTLG